MQVLYHIIRGGAIGGQGAKPPQRFQKGKKMKKYGVFSCIKVIKISFSVIFKGLLLQF